MVNWESWEQSLLQNRVEDSIILSSSFLSHNRSIAYSIKECEHYYREMNWNFNGWFIKSALKDKYSSIYDEIESHITAAKCPNEERLKTLQKFIYIRIYLLEVYTMGLYQRKSIQELLLKMKDLLFLWGNEFLDLYSYTRFEIIAVKYLIDAEMANTVHDILGSTTSLHKAYLSLKEWRNWQKESDNLLYEYVVGVLHNETDKIHLLYSSLIPPNGFKSFYAELYFLFSTHRCKYSHSYRLHSKSFLIFRSTDKNHSVHSKYTCVPPEEYIDGLASFPIIHQNISNTFSNPQIYMPTILSLLQSSSKTKGSIKKLVTLNMPCKDSFLKPGHVIYCFDEHLGILFYLVRLDVCFYLSLFATSRVDIHPTCHVLTRMIKSWNYIKEN